MIFQKKKKYHQISTRREKRNIFSLLKLKKLNLRFLLLNNNKNKKPKPTVADNKKSDFIFLYKFPNCRRF